MGKVTEESARARNQGGVFRKRLRNTVTLSAIHDDGYVLFLYTTLC